jgi:hypothetical protein
MATIAPGRLHDVSNAADFVALTQTNFEILTSEVFKHEPTYVSGVPTTTVGPPSTGSHVLTEIWKDALGGWWRCTAAGTPGTWRQVLPAAVTADPATGNHPHGLPDPQRHAGDAEASRWGILWEAIVGATGGKIGFYGVDAGHAAGGAEPSGRDAWEHGRRDRRPHDLRSAHSGRGSGPAGQGRGVGR